MTKSNFDEILRTLSGELGQDYYEWLVATVALTLGIGVLQEFRSSEGLEKTRDLITRAVINLLDVEKADGKDIEVELENARTRAVELFIRKIEYVLKKDSSDGNGLWC